MQAEGKDPSGMYYYLYGTLDHIIIPSKGLDNWIINPIIFHYYCYLAWRPLSSLFFIPDVTDTKNVSSYSLSPGASKLKFEFAWSKIVCYGYSEI